MSGGGTKMKSKCGNETNRILALSVCFHLAEISIFELGMTCGMRSFREAADGSDRFVPSRSCTTAECKHSGSYL